MWDPVPSRGDPFICMGSEPGGEGNLTWFQIPPTTVNLFGYLLTVSWQLTFMFKIKCLIDYFLEQWWDVVLYLSQSISGLSHYRSLFLPFLAYWACVCVHVWVCKCTHVHQRVGELEDRGRSPSSESGGKLGLYIFPKLCVHKDFPASNKRWLILGMIHR